MVKPFQQLVIVGLTFGLCACIEIQPIMPPKDPPLNSSINPICQPPPIAQNIVGTWHFVTNRLPCCTLRKGTVTFQDQHTIIDPDSLFENHIEGISSSLTQLDKVDYKIYAANGDNYLVTFPEIKEILFVVELGTNGKRNWVKWPFYVYSNECDKIIIYHTGSYNKPLDKKEGFTLTR